ncbi:putative ABC-type xenobiotic transporter, partial [Tanacetum coccineum]
WKALDDGDGVIDKVSLDSRFLQRRCVVVYANGSKQVFGKPHEGLSTYVSTNSGSNGPIWRIHGYGYGILKSSFCNWTIILPQVWRRKNQSPLALKDRFDAYRMGEFPMWFHVSWSSFIQLILAIGVLFSIVGIGVLPGLAPIIIYGLLNLPFAKAIQKCQLEFMVAQDKRLRSTSEILNNMKVIKLQLWEEKFKNIIESCRDSEFHWLLEAQFKKVYGTMLYWMSPTLISSVILFGCALLRSAPLDAAIIFTILATLRTMSEPVRLLPDEISALIQDGDFVWDPATTPTLRNVNLEVKRGQKVAVCGSVSARKSSMLYAILGEVSKTLGTVDISGSIAYVSQTSWIQSGMIQDNILYGKPMNKTMYEKAIKACALDKDIEEFKHGDLTEIGQRGLNMSEGQKQRIQLARAV